MCLRVLACASVCERVLACASVCERVRACASVCERVRACASVCVRACVCETTYIPKLKGALSHEYLRNWDRFHKKAAICFILQ